MRNILVLFVCISFGLLKTYALVMQGTQYNIEFDSVNVGGNLSTSTAYSVEDSLGEIATGYSSSTSYTMHAGYQQQEDITISISAPADVNMIPLTLTQNTSVGSTAWTITTNNPAGYTLSLNAGSSPALIGNAGRQFADVGTTPATWSVVNNYQFGFSIYGVDVSTATFGTDTDCINTANVPSATLKWRGFIGTTPIPVVNTTSSALYGNSTVLCVASGQSGTLAPSDTYTATITATAATN